LIASPDSAIAFAKLNKLPRFIRTITDGDGSRL
jgi:hypothetical protein